MMEEEEDHMDKQGPSLDAFTLGGLELSGIDMIDRDWEVVKRKRSRYEKGYNMGEVYQLTDGKGGTAHMKEDGRYEEIKITADSGAVDHVAPRSLAKGVPICETKASRQGVHYIAANGSEIRNEGEKKICGYTDNGKPINMTWQIAGVKKPLASIGRICDAGNVATFTDKGGVYHQQECGSKHIGGGRQVRGQDEHVPGERGV